MHKLIQLEKIIKKRTGSLREEIEIATNVQLSPLYIADRRDEVEFLEDQKSCQTSFESG
jgi:hypothetical protein